MDEIMLKRQDFIFTTHFPNLQCRIVPENLNLILSENLSCKEVTRDLA
jgi:hypothetical protein